MNAMSLSDRERIVITGIGAISPNGLGAEAFDLACRQGRSGMLHPTINLDTPDPRCDLDYVPHQARGTTAKTALCNCIAFGSKNSALVVKVVTS